MSRAAAAQFHVFRHYLDSRGDFYCSSSSSSSSCTGSAASMTRKKVKIVQRFLQLELLPLLTFLNMNLISNFCDRMKRGGEMTDTERKKEREVCKFSLEPQLCNNIKFNDQMTKFDQSDSSEIRTLQNNSYNGHKIVDLKKV
jgi:hypothetical protein